MIPRIVHFVFGLREQTEPFHFLHYVALESARRVVEPERIVFHYKHLPWGEWWERIEPELTLVEVELPAELATPAPARDGEGVAERYRYAHHADFVRLDALLEHGGIYADIDTVFLRPPSSRLLAAPFVIGREPPVRHERTGELLPSLCNAIMLSIPGARFAACWRERMAGALDGTWSNHSGFLSEQISRELPHEVLIEPEVSFFPFPGSTTGLTDLLTRRCPVPGESFSVHLWSHLWWERDRRDFTSAHAGWGEPRLLRWADTTLAELVRTYIPRRALSPRGLHSTQPESSAQPASAQPRAPAPLEAGDAGAPWTYISLDESSGYGDAARRAMSALEHHGVEVRWLPLQPRPEWGMWYAPALPLSLPEGGARPILVAHTVPEYLPRIRSAAPDGFLVAHTVWDTDRLPRAWPALLELADLVIVPSAFSAAAMAASGVRRAVAIVPHALPAPLRPPPVAPNRATIFYTIGEWTERKNLAHTVDAYCRAFRADDAVLLLVKTSHRDWRVPNRQISRAGPGTSAYALAQQLAHHRDPPPVRLLSGPVDDAGIATLHQNADCFVSLCRSEGFGLGAFDAASTGNPVIITAHGGQLDYLHGSPYLVGHELVPVLDAAGGESYTPDQRWAQPDLAHAVELMRAVAGDRQAARAAVTEIAERIQRQFAPHQVAERMLRAVADRLSGMPGPG